MIENRAVSDRISIGFLPRPASELAELVEETGMSKTDLVNRAVTLYRFVTKHLDEGDHFLIRDGDSGEVERIRLV